MEGMSRVVVRIMGRDYPVMSGDKPEHVRRVAALVDQRMRAIASSGRYSIDRVAVLAALKLADDICRLKEQSDREREETRRLRAELDRLSQAGPVIIAVREDGSIPRNPGVSGGSRPKKA